MPATRITARSATWARPSAVHASSPLGACRNGKHGVLAGQVYLTARLPDDFGVWDRSVRRTDTLRADCPRSFGWVTRSAQGLDHSEILVFDRFLRVPVNNCDWKTGGGRAE